MQCPGHVGRKVQTPNYHTTVSLYLGRSKACSQPQEADKGAVCLYHCARAVHINSCNNAKRLLSHKSLCPRV